MADLIAQRPKGGAVAGNFTSITIDGTTIDPGGFEDLLSHIANKNNPHGVTATDVGLGNVDNTPDLDKVISNKTQAALDLKADLIGGKVPESQLPDGIGKQWDDSISGVLSTPKRIIIGSNDSAAPLRMLGSLDSYVTINVMPDSIRFMSSDNVGGYRFDKRVYPYVDDTNDFGVSTARWRSIWASRTVRSDINITIGGADTGSITSETNRFTIWRSDGANYLQLFNSGTNIGLFKGPSTIDAANRFLVTNTNIRGQVDATYDLGTPAIRWKNIYLSNDITLDGESVKDKLKNIPDDYYWELADNGRCLVPKLSNGTNLGIDINYSSYFRSGIYISKNNYITFYNSEETSEGNGNIQADSTSLRFARSGTVADFKFVGPVRPGVDNSYDLGNESFRWKSGYFRELYTSGSTVGVGARLTALEEGGGGDSFWNLNSSNYVATDNIIENKGMFVRPAGSVTAGLEISMPNNSTANIYCTAGTIYFDSSLVPVGLRDLGNSTYMWRNLYLSNDIWINGKGINSRLTALENAPVNHWTLYDTSLMTKYALYTTDAKGLTIYNGSVTAAALQLLAGTSSYAVINAGSRGIELRDTTYFGPYTNNATDLGMSNYRFKVGYFNGLSVNGEVAANSIAVPKIVTDEINGQTFMPLAAKSLWTGTWSTGTITVSGGIENGSVLLIRINSANPDMIVTVKDGKIRGLSGYTTASLHYTIEIDWTITSAGVISSVVTGPISYIAHNSGGSHGTMNQTSLSVTGIYLLGIAL